MVPHALWAGKHLKCKFIIVFWWLWEHSGEGGHFEVKQVRPLGCTRTNAVPLVERFRHWLRARARRQNTAGRVPISGAQDGQKTQTKWSDGVWAKQLSRPLLQWSGKVVQFLDNHNKQMNVLAASYCQWLQGRNTFSFWEDQHKTKNNINRRVVSSQTLTTAGPQWVPPAIK